MIYSRLIVGVVLRTVNPDFSLIYFFKSPVCPRPLLQFFTCLAAGSLTTFLCLVTALTTVELINRVLYVIEQLLGLSKFDTAIRW